MPPVTPDDLVDAIVRGDVDRIGQALRADPSLAHATTADGDTLLHIACWQKMHPIVGTLLAYDPDLNARGRNGRTPLHYAVQEGGAISLSLVALLLARGADPSIRDDNGCSVEDWAKIEMRDRLEDLLWLLRDAEKYRPPQS
jgi:ankyrin repeat protein